MSGPSPRYVAAHFLFPAFLRANGIAAVLRAIEHKDTQFFLPVWVEAGFRFTPNLLYAEHEGYRIGALTFPTPRELTEAYMGAVIGRGDDPSFVRYFTWELGFSPVEQRRATVLGEWNLVGAHVNHGPGPIPSGYLPTDVWQFVQAALQTLEPSAMLQ